MAEQLQFDFSGKQQRPQPKLLRTPVVIEGVMEYSKTPYAHVNRFHWFARELEIRRGVTAGDNTESGLSFKTIASELLDKINDPGWINHSALSDRFKIGGRLNRREFAHLLIDIHRIDPPFGMEESMRQPSSVTTQFHAWWGDLKRLYTDEEWPGSD